MTAESFVNGLARYVDQHFRKSIHVYAGYSQTSGALLLKVKDSDARVAVRPWLRQAEVGMQDIIRSNQRYSVFRGQEPTVFVHVAAEFRQNARRYARRSANCALIVPKRSIPAIEIIGSQNVPQAIRDALIAQAREKGSDVKYDFEGTVVQENPKGRKVNERVAAHAANPTAFISYSWDSEVHRRWVLKLAADLMRNGVRVRIDEWDLPSFNNDLHHFMESSVRESDFVVVVCTPSYAERANNRKGGVGVESTIITGEFYGSVGSQKFIPIARNASVGIQGVLPSYLKTKLAIDFTDDSAYQSRLEDLLRRLLNQPRFRRPELGVVPRLESEDL